MSPSVEVLDLGAFVQGAPRGEPLPKEMEDRLFRKGSYGCPCARAHVPRPTRLLVHHILPLAWGGQDVESNRVALCATTWLAVADLLVLLQQGGAARKLPSMKTFPYFARRLAMAAFWQFNSSSPLPMPPNLDAAASLSPDPGDAVQRLGRTGVSDVQVEEPSERAVEEQLDETRRSVALFRNM